MKITNVAFAVVLTFFIVGLVMSAIYTGSTDPSKSEFQLYGQYENLSQIDNNGTISSNNSNNSVSNMQYQALTMMNELSDAQRQLNSQNPAEQLLGAFGTVQAVTLSAGFLLVGIFLDGANFIWGILANLTNLPSPWHYFGVLAVVVVTLFTIYLAFRIMSLIFKWEV